MPHESIYISPDLTSQWNVAIEEMHIAVNRLTIYSLTSDGRPVDETNDIITDGIDIDSLH